MSNYRIGVDVGGTFTDALMIDDITGEISASKVPSTPHDPSIAVMNSIPKRTPEILESTQIFVHGTTIAENALIQRRGSRVGLIATKGQRDRIEIQRGNLEWEFDFYYSKPKPLVPRTLRKEVKERTASDGVVLIPVDKDELIKVAKELVDARVEAISVLFLNSYANSQNEQDAKNIIQREYPNTPVVTSSEVLPEMLEYERFSATVLSTYLRPIVEAYLEKMQSHLHTRGFRGDLMIMQANGGIMTPDTAKKRTCLLIESGVAGGVVGALDICGRIGFTDVITFDMGGTTAKACLIRGGAPSINTENLKERFPVNFPMIDMVSIGAGGGSIAWVDEQHGLHVGPRSAGADPGPACYGKGGTDPTVTDAHVVLGIIDPAKFLGGDMKIYPELANQAVMKIARHYDLDLVRAAAGLLRIVNDNMASLIRLISVEKGHDPRDFVLTAFGGAGPMHAALIAKELKIPKVIIPPLPGIHSAYGMVFADIKHDFVRGMVSRTALLDIAVANDLFAEMESEAHTLLNKEGVPQSSIEMACFLDMRYVGQSFSIMVRLFDQEKPVTTPILKVVERRFHDLHYELYRYRREDAPTQVVNLRLSAVGRTNKAVAKRVSLDPNTKPVRTTTNVYFEGSGFLACDSIDRSSLATGLQIQGPAIIHQKDSTSIIYPRQRAHVDDYGNIIVDIKDSF